MTSVWSHVWTTSSAKIESLIGRVVNLQKDMSGIVCSVTLLASFTHIIVGTVGAFETDSNDLRIANITNDAVTSWVTFGRSGGVDSSRAFFRFGNQEGGSHLSQDGIAQELLKEQLGIWLLGLLRIGI